MQPNRFTLISFISASRRDPSDGGGSGSSSEPLWINIFAEKCMFESASFKHFHIKRCTLHSVDFLWCFCFCCCCCCYCQLLLLLIFDGEPHVANENIEETKSCVYEHLLARTKRTWDFAHVLMGRPVNVYTHHTEWVVILHVRRPDQPTRSIASVRVRNFCAINSSTNHRRSRLDMFVSSSRTYKPRMTKFLIVFLLLLLLYSHCIARLNCSESSKFLIVRRCNGSIWEYSPVAMNECGTYRMGRVSRIR